MGLLAKMMFNITPDIKLCTFIKLTPFFGFFDVVNAAIDVW